MSRDTFTEDRLPPIGRQPVFLLDGLDYPERLNAGAELIDRAIERGEGGRLAIVTDQVRWTYADLHAAADRIARLLVEQEGLIPGNRVLLRGANGAMLFAAWLAVLKAGGVVVTTMPLLRAAELLPILDRARISHAIVDAACLADFEEAAARASIRPRTLVYDGDRGGGALERRIAQVADGFGAVDTGRDEPAALAFTSGTTGVPKATVHYHRDLLIPADGFARAILAPRPGDVFCGTPPIAFTFGLGALLLFPLRCLGASAMVAGAGPDALLDTIERHRVTMLFTAPTAYKAMLPRLAGRDLSSLRVCVSAGEPLPAACAEDWRRATGLRLVDGIGATEMMHIFISARPNEARPGWTGKAVPGYVARVLDEEGRPRESGVGRLAIRGPTGCRYLDNPQAQARYVVDGWNVTGDTYEIDPEGWCRFVARSDDMIISSGYNIAAPEVEAALYLHPAVAECAVVAHPDRERGHVVKAFVVAAEGADAGPALARALQDHVKARIAPYKYPRLIEFVEVLPKTSTGKIRRHVLREQGRAT